MNLKIFQSDKGDCLLLEASSGELMLCDGGMGPSMRTHVRAELGKLRDDDRELALVYVSHIDNDHINGVLQLLEDEASWRVFELHNADGDPDVSMPDFPRPPVIRGILHNGFRDLITEIDKPIDKITANSVENLLGAMVPSLFGTAEPALMDLAAEMASIATGVPEGIQVARLIAADALNIPLNQPPGVNKQSRLLFAGKAGDEFQLGSMKFTLIGPTKKELDDLRKGWLHFLRNPENKEKLKKLRAELKKRIEEFSAGSLTDSPFDLRGWEGIPDFKGVTVPNIASMMFMVEEDGKRLLLTGDCQQDFILAGLDRTGFLNDGHLHLDVLKVQHHGSEHNMDADFAGKVSADNYVFCGNGEHENPDLRVIKIIFDSRANDAPAKKFHFWFSTTSEMQTPGTQKRVHFQAVERKAKELASNSNGRLVLHFNENASISLKI